MNKLRGSYQSLSPNARQAFRFMLGCSVALLAFAVYAFHRLLETGWVLERIANVVPMLLGLAALASALLVASGRSAWGGRVFISSVTLAMFVLALVVADMGFLLAIIVFVVTIYVSSLVFPSHILSVTLILGFFAAALVLLIDIFCPWTRDVIDPTDLRFTTYLALVFLFLYSVFIVRNFRGFPIQAKLVLASLALTIIPLAFTGTMINRSTERLLVENADQFLTNAASQTSIEIDSFIRYNLDSVRVEAQMGELVSLLELPPEERLASQPIANTGEILAALLKKDPVYITSYGVIDAQGRTVIDTSPEEFGVDNSQRGYFTEVMRAGLPYVSPVQYSPVTGKPSIFFSAPIRSATGKILGVLRARYNADVLQRILTQSGSRAEGAFSMIVSDQRILLAHTTFPEWMYSSITPLTAGQATALREQYLLPDSGAVPVVGELPDLALALDLSPGQSVQAGEFHQEHFQEQAGGRERVAVVRLRNAPWYLLVGQPETVLFAPVKDQLRRTLLYGVGAAMLSIVFSILIASYLSKPIINLTQAANRMAGGDLYARSLVSSQDETGALARAFNHMAEQLSSLVGTLEQRVAERTKALETSAEVSRELTTILNENQLIRTVVDKLQDAFHYYHVHIYLFDEQGKMLVMRGGSGEAGQKMLANHHQIPRGRGLVGRAANLAAPVLIADTQSDPGWLPNSLLPETRSELAVPIAIGESVLGVLDVQQNVTGGLTEADASLMQAVANQFAIAIQNARSFARAQRQAEREALINTISERIQAANSVDDALQVAVREIGRALGAKRATVRLGMDQPSGDR